MITLQQRAAQLDALVQGGLVRHLHQEVVAASIEGESHAKKLATQRLRVRTGRLRASIQAEVQESANTLRLTLRAGQKQIPYAALQEYGGTITPKGGRFLAIPADVAQTGAGVSRYSSPRDVPGLRFVSIRGGAAGLLVKDLGGKNTRSQIWFYLVRRVRVRPTFYMRDAAAFTRQSLMNRISRRMTEVLGGV